MNSTRLDSLRNMAAAIGEQQRAYWKFFPPFADLLARELGEYMGDPSAVALSSATGEFAFEGGSYHHAGLGFADGKFRIPLMFRIKHLHDDGEDQVRIRLYFVMEADRVTAEIVGEPPITVNNNDLTSLLAYVYQHLCTCFSSTYWFAQHPTDYQGTAIGFSRPS